MGTIRETFFGSTPRGVVTVAVVLLAVVLGAFVAGIIGTPSVVGVENRFGEVTAAETTIRTDLVVNNPNPIGVTLGGATVNYTVRMNGVAMASGSKEGIGIGTGNTTLEFTTPMRNEKIPAWWISHVDNGERTRLELNATVHSSLAGQSVTVPYSQEITTDVIGQFNSEKTRPVNAGNPLIEDPVLYVNETSAAWGSVSESETPIDMAFTVYNPKATPYTITEIGYEITMNDVRVGEGATDEPHVIEGNAETTIEAATAIRNQRLDEWWVSHLERNQVTDLRIDFYARVELPVGETIRIPLDELDYEKRIETDFFGTKPDSGGDGAEDSRTDGTSTATTTPDDGGLPDETATENGTDDGGLLDIDTWTDSGHPRK